MQKDNQKKIWKEGIKIKKCSDRSTSKLNFPAFKKTLADQPTDRPTNQHRVHREVILRTNNNGWK